jgi:hypothetical protein
MGHPALVWVKLAHFYYYTNGRPAEDAFGIEWHLVSEQAAAEITTSLTQKLMSPIILYVLRNLALAGSRFGGSAQRQPTSTGQHSDFEFRKLMSTRRLA